MTHIHHHKGVQSPTVAHTARNGLPYPSPLYARTWPSEGKRGPYRERAAGPCVITPQRVGYTAILHLTLWQARGAWETRASYRLHEQ